MNIAYEPIEARIAEWAELQENIRVVLVFGSRVNWSQDADAWADLDLVVIAANPQAFANDLAWLKEIGEPWVAAVKPALLPQD